MSRNYMPKLAISWWNGIFSGCLQSHSRERRQKAVGQDDPKLSVRRQCRLLSLTRSTLYYELATLIDWEVFEREWAGLFPSQIGRPAWLRGCFISSMLFGSRMRRSWRDGRRTPTMLFELTRGTWSNTDKMARQFYAITLKPWLTSWAWAYSRVLFTPKERAAFYVEFVTDDLLTTNAAARTGAQMRFHARKRVGADVTHPDRFIKLRVAV